MDTFQVVVQHLDPTIEQRSHRKEAFLLRVDEVLGRPPRKNSEDFVGHHIPPTFHLIGKPGVLFSRFFSHRPSLSIQLYQKGAETPRPSATSINRTFG